MALPNQKRSSVAEQQAQEGIPQDRASVDNSAALKILQSLLSQQDEHQVLLDQVASLHSFWDKQQQWNEYAHKNKILKESVFQLGRKHKTENDARRMKNLMMQRQFELEKETSRREQSREMCGLRQELVEHQQKWKLVMEDLNSNQASVHTHLSGRIMMKKANQRQYAENKAMLNTVMDKLHQRMKEQKQVSAGSQASAGKGIYGAAVSGANEPRRADIAVGDDSGGDKGKGKKRCREEQGAVNDED